ncbi:MAG TPA: ATP-binding protein, partial [Candidatus Limnocylindria bacterium]|nr:ATP-binding protein [Candidatus Limnocylindria bacterium]
RAGESIAVLTEQGAGEPARSLTLELEARRKDGSTVWTETSVTILRGADGTPTSLLGVARDISARVHAEDALRRSEEHLRQAQKMEAIGRLAGGVAHDFNNIMTVIDGRSQLMLAKASASDPARRDIEIVRQAAKRATGLTRQLLAFSRKQVLQPRVLDLNAVVASMTDLLRRLIGEDIELSTVPGRDLMRVQADPSQLEQVIMNLAVNARDAMPAGGRLTIETRNVELAEPVATDSPGTQAGPHVMVSVTDTGTGMDEATRARVFEPFFTTKGAGKGTGLGLSTVYGIVTQSGGRVAVTSAPGAGSTFTVWLPAVEAAPETGATAATGGAAPGTETILLVEDEESVRELAQELLESLGYVVVAAANGPEALAVCGRPEQRIDLMLTDVIMPQMSGKETAVQARRLRQDLKVLYMSGYTDDALGRHGVLDSDITLLEKPFSRDALATKVRGVLDAGRPTVR